MRNRASLSLTFLAGGLAGCFSGSSAGPPVQDDAETPLPGMDAAPMDATTPPQDATVPTEAAPEAAGPEASAEAAVEAGPSPVKVTIVNHLGPEPGVYIVFQDVNGNVVDTAMTDATGTVTQALGSATQVTALMGSTPPPESFAVVHTDGLTLEAGVVIPPPTNVQLVTVQGVEPGDTLTLSDPSDTTYANATVSVDGVPDGGPPGTQSYAVAVGSCLGYSDESVNFPSMVYLSADCESNGTFPVLVTAVDGNNRNLGYAWQYGNTIPSDGGTAHVVVTGSWSTATSNQTITADSVLPSDNLSSAYSELADNVASPVSNPLTVEDASASATFTGHPGYPTAIQNEVALTAYGEGSLAVSAIATRGPFDADSGATFDLSTALPLITSAIQDAGIPASDADVPPSSQPYVAWSSDAGSLAPVSGIVVQVNWYNYQSQQTSGAWTIVVPPTATSVTAPALPPQLAGWWSPSSDANFNYEPLVVAVQSTALPTYTAFRNQFATLPVTSNYVNNGGGPFVPPLPAAGTVRVTAIATQNGG
jgi:hypothetical protein